MNERKRFIGGRKKPAPIDGIVSSGRQLGVPRAKFVQRGQKVSLGGSLQQMTDGFYPMRASNSSLGQGAEADEAAMLDEPIVLDELPSEPAKRFGRLGRAARWLKDWNLKKAGQCLAALVLICGVYFGVKLFIAEHNLFHGGGGAPALAANIDINQLKGEGDGRINVLILGIGGPGHQGANLTDSMLLASIDPINHKTALLSVPRDLWVQIPGNGSQKINSAYSDGLMESSAKSQAGKERDGLNLLDKTLSPVLGIPIHYHVVVDFRAFQQVVDSIGGVNANVPFNLTASENFWIEGTSRHYYLYVPSGQQHFNGQKALYYARERHNDSDFVRSQRQRLLLDSIKQKIFTLGTFSNPVKISNLLSSVGNNVYTDFSLSDMTRLYQIVSKIPNNKIASLDLVTPPHDYLTTADIDGLSTVEPKAGLYQYKVINSYVRNALRDSFLAKENANIAVYNATDIAGLASSEADILKSYGYTISTVANTKAVSNPAKTVVVDLTHGKDKYTAHYLDLRFGVTTVSSVPSSSGVTPPNGSNFVIILGRDAEGSGG